MVVGRTRHAHVNAQPPPLPCFSPGGCAGVFPPDLCPDRPATAQAAAVAALRQRVRSEEREVRTGEVGGWRR